MPDDETRDESSEPMADSFGHPIGEEPDPEKAEPEGNGPAPQPIADHAPGDSAMPPGQDRSEEEQLAAGGGGEESRPSEDSP
jgi:hypothetical protein